MNDRELRANLSVDAERWPDPWAHILHRNWPKIAVFAAIISALLAASVWLYTILPDDIGRQRWFFFAAIPAFLWFLTIYIDGIYFALSVKRRGRRNLVIRNAAASDSMPRTFIAGRRSTAYFRIVQFLAFAGFGAAIFASGTVTSEETGSAFRAALGTYPVGAAAIGLSMIHLPFAPLRRFRRTGIALTPDRIYHCWLSGRQSFTWEEIGQIVPRKEHPLIIELQSGARTRARQRPPETTFLYRLRFFERQMRRIRAGYLAINPVLVYEALVFYHQNPQYRHELGTQASIDRIRNLDQGPPPPPPPPQPGAPRRAPVRRVSLEEQGRDRRPGNGHHPPHELR